MLNIVVTGASGFIGNNLIKNLSNDFNVMPISKNSGYNMANPIEIIDITGPSAMGDDVLWSEDFADSTTTNIVTEDIAGYGNWHWGEESPGGMWSENAGIIQSETPENGFMIMEADFYNSNPQNDLVIDDKATKCLSNNTPYLS